MNPLFTILSGSGRNMAGNLAAVAEAKQILSGQNPSAVFSMLMRNNPQFSRFVQENQGKSPEEIARAYGIDADALRQIFG